MAWLTVDSCCRYKILVILARGQHNIISNTEETLIVETGGTFCLSVALQQINNQQWSTHYETTFII